MVTIGLLAGAVGVQLGAVEPEGPTSSGELLPHAVSSMAPAANPVIQLSDFLMVSSFRVVFLSAGTY
jgi:hypothetical protein